MTATLPVGQCWDGSQLTSTAYPTGMRVMEDPTRVTNVTDPDDGQSSIQFSCLDTDFNTQMAAHPNPRAQIQCDWTEIVNGGAYLWYWELKIKREWMPTTLEGWVQWGEQYGKPWGGSPSMSWGAHASHPGQYGLYHGAGSDPQGAIGDPLALVPIVYDSYQRLEFEFQMADSGLLIVRYDGMPIYDCPTFDVINVADATGPWAVYPQIYAQRGTFTSMQCLQRGHKLTRLS